MNKKLLLGLVLTITCMTSVGAALPKLSIAPKPIQEYQGQTVNAEIWNKSGIPVNLTVSNNQPDIGDNKNKITLLANGYQALKSIDISKPIYFTFWGYGSPNIQAMFLVTPKNKTVHVRLKSEKGQDVFGPQTGTLKGLTKTSVRGLTLKNNIKASDITQLTAAQINEFIKKLAPTVKYQPGKFVVK